MFYGYFVYDWLLGRAPIRQDDDRQHVTPDNDELNKAIVASINDPPP
jgi:hypothetical protein